LFLLCTNKHWKKIICKLNMPYQRRFQISQNKAWELQNLGKPRPLRGKPLSLYNIYCSVLAYEHMSYRRVPQHLYDPMSLKYICISHIWAASRQNQHNGFATSMDPDQSFSFYYLNLSISVRMSRDFKFSLLRTFLKLTSTGVIRGTILFISETQASI
jgi:hypothetical protein